VLVVRDAAPLEGWLLGERPLRIIVGTDLSPISDFAIRWAIALGQISTCLITIVHAARTADPHKAEALERDLRRRVEEWNGPSETHFVVNYKTGRPGRYLARLAAPQQADLLVLGTRQRTGLDRLWCGTVAGEALFLAQTNVACIPALAPAEQRAQPIPRMRRILAATDFSKTGNAALAHAYALLAGGGVVHLVHVLQPPPFSKPWVDLTLTVDKASEHHLARQLAALIPDDTQARGIVSQIMILENSDVAEGICETAKRLDVDTICVGNRGRLLADAVLGSVAHGVANGADEPVLLVPFADLNRRDTTRAYSVSPPNGSFGLIGFPAEPGGIARS
jgi:nucleotide-binding universal stress UspA family protein